MEITINQQTIHYKNTAKIPQNKAQKRLENVVDKIMTKIKLAIKEQQIVRLHQELTRETWTWWMQQFPKNYCHFHLGQHINIQNLYTDKTKQLFDTTILRQLEQFVRKNNLITQRTYGRTDVRKQHWYTLTEDIIPEELSTIKLSKQLTKLWFQETTDKLLSSSSIALHTKLRVCYSLDIPKNYL
ncbi:hypothetical protein G9A89_019300 [Geosiphon pyriformis]|nr:hypothetical protein G9A89_019300 [Geosiphon pyriformis]